MKLCYFLTRENFNDTLNPFKPKGYYEDTRSLSKETGPKRMEAVEERLLGI
jgi:hypothetical protein